MRSTRGPARSVFRKQMDVAALNRFHARNAAHCCIAAGLPLHLEEYEEGTLREDGGEVLGQGATALLHLGVSANHGWCQQAGGRVRGASLRVSRCSDGTSALRTFRFRLRNNPLLLRGPRTAKQVLEELAEAVAIEVGRNELLRRAIRVSLTPPRAAPTLPQAGPHTIHTTHTTHAQQQQQQQQQQQLLLKADTVDTVPQPASPGAATPSYPTLIRSTSILSTPHSASPCDSPVTSLSPTSPTSTIGYTSSAISACSSPIAMVASPSHTSPPGGGTISAISACSSPIVASASPTSPTSGGTPTVSAISACSSPCSTFSAGAACAAAAVMKGRPLSAAAAGVGRTDAAPPASAAATSAGAQPTGGTNNTSRPLCGSVPSAAHGLPHTLLALLELDHSADSPSLSPAFSVPSAAAGSPCASAGLRALNGPRNSAGLAGRVARLLLSECEPAPAPAAPGPPGHIPRSEPHNHAAVPPAELALPVDESSLEDSWRQLFCCDETPPPRPSSWRLLTPEEIARMEAPVPPHELPPLLEFEPDPLAACSREALLQCARMAVVLCCLVSVQPVPGREGEYEAKWGEDVG